MNDVPNDTTDKAAAAQISLLRNASFAHRVALTRSLSATTMELARRAIARRNPGATETDNAIRFVDLSYGPELAAKVRQYMKKT